ncbi:MAG: polysaccharide export protein [Cyanobacteria bacterium RYN_339]|nr:polysaccharide export protein [Cyanobacteria bacterium RYN_339]
MQRLITTFVLALALICLGTTRPAFAVYLLDYGDAIAIQVKDFPQYNYAGAVRPDGLISIPFVGDIEVGGLTTGQATTRLTTVLKKFLRDPIVTVTLTTLRPRFAMVLGQVNSPGRVELNRPHPTVLDVIGAAGGFTHRAVRTEVIILRGEGTRASHYTVDVERMLKTADLSQNIEVLPGDRVSVPEVWYPNLPEIMATIAPTIAAFTTLISLIAIYNSLSAQSQR